MSEPQQEEWYTRRNVYGQHVVYGKGRVNANPWKLSDGEVCRCDFEADADRIIADNNAARQQDAHNERGERWQYLMSLKTNDAIGQAFALLEESFLHHTLERDGWTPDDTCYMETSQVARQLIERQQDELRALVDDVFAHYDEESLSLGDVSCDYCGCHIGHEPHRMLDGVYGDGTKLCPVARYAALACSATVREEA